MRVVLGLAVWALSLGMTYLVGDIAYSSDINKYMDSTNLVGAYIIGSLVIDTGYCGSGYCVAGMGACQKKAALCRRKGHGIQHSI